ncbi:MAG: thioredoxin domain-containing protein [Balneola sp.]|nr:MAG: thioredoxin domain-containing protein [Balneola sp.]
MNRLSKEKSPYLLQHQNNPVDWYPWGDEAFAKAKKENKPVFLSIGYATCHWCHVMEHESFEDEEIADQLNQAFINVKVDREERPDIDSTYMTVCQMLNGHGGWPLSLFLTPDKEPFFAATYIPKEARYGRIGLRQLIRGIQGMWIHEPDKISQAVESIKHGFKNAQEFQAGEFPGTEAIDFAAEQLITNFDEEFAGFGSAPKFLTPHNLMFLLRQWHHTKEERFLNAVSKTLTAMRFGGIWDHIGHGFHRYSTDREWLLPHFEKMLYDQALLMIAYTETWQVTKNPLFKKTVCEIAEYVESNLTNTEGAFFSAEDADSEGEEGKFYLWDTNELQGLLSKDQFSFFSKEFQILEEGNFEDEATKQKNGKNIPHLKADIASEKQKDWKSIRELVYKEREKRIRPLLDDKILTDWNALMIIALAKAGAAFGDDELIQKAEKAYQFINRNLFEGNDLLHRYKDREAEINAFADDYAFLIWASLELYESTFNSDYLNKAIELNTHFLNEFWDEKAGGLFFSIDDKDQPLGRQKQIYDGAIPSSNSVSLLNLVRLARFTGDTSLDEKAQELGKCFSTDLIRAGSSSTASMMALQFLYHEPREIVITEGSGDQELFAQYLRELFLPSKVLLFRPLDEDNSVYESAPYLTHLKSIEKASTVYVCKDYSCDTPTLELEILKEQLAS